MATPCTQPPDLHVAPAPRARARMRGARHGRPEALAVILALLCGSWCPCAGAAEGGAGAGEGEAASVFVRLPAEPVGRSLAGAHCARVSGPAALAWNPAGLALRDGAGVHVAHTDWVAGTAWEWVGLALALPGMPGIVGLSAGLLRTDPLEGYAADGTSTGSFRPVQLLGTLAYARRVTPRISGGLQLEVVHESDGNQTDWTCLAWGLGLQWQPGRVALGAAATHLTTGVRSGADHGPLPATVRGGASLDLGAGIDLHLGVEGGRAQTSRLLSGASWQPLEVVTAYAGMRVDLEENERRTQPAGGLSVHAGAVTVTYGYRPALDLEVSHQIGLEIPLATPAGCP